MSVKQEILPCPFCGASASVEEFPAGTGRPSSVTFSVGCDSSSEGECYGYLSFQVFNTPGEAIAGWNKRAPQKQ